MSFIIRMLKGATIGVGMIIPGISGGTLAVLLGIYDEMILRISSLRREFKTSFMYLLPILLGMVLAFAAMYYPLKLALKYIPFELCMTFVAMMLCSTPRIAKDAYRSGFYKKDVVLSVVAFAFCIGICCIPDGKELVLNLRMEWYMYPVLFLVGALASIALVVPGISGSMLLLILGLYTPLLDTIENLFKTPLDAFVILLIFAIGLIFGFFTVAKLMQTLLKRFEHQTRWAIFGFVLASILALFIVFDFNNLLTPLHIGLGCGCFALIVLIHFLIYFYLYKKKQGREKEIEEVE